MAGGPLAGRLRPCGPVASGGVPPLTLERLMEASGEGGWRATLDQALPALEPVFAASPYLGGLARRWPEILRSILEADPEDRLADILERTHALDGEPDELRTPLRLLKAELHLLAALSDLGGVWSLDRVTGALSDFADATVTTAFRSVARAAVGRGRLPGVGDGEEGPIPGLFCLAMGKHGAGELNYSSDIDVTFFHDPEALAAVLTGAEAQGFADRAAGALARLLSERTAEGYVFRVDLRLRPDPASTPPVVSAPAALNYYETVGQNWERAAFLKARPLAGDLPRAREFLEALTPFVWRRNLDFAAIADVHSIKRQIHVHKADERLEAAGADLKLGRGGIREIEFYVQTQQLILGGRDPSLRSSRTLEALAALARAGHVKPDTADFLTTAYERLRALEHRVQMLDDEQTHTLPEQAQRRAAVAALAGEGDLARFDQGVSGLLKGVNSHYGALFADDEALSSEFGSLVFTGVDNDPETLRTLGRMGFSDPDQVASTVRAWHHGRIPATRSARGREVFTRLGPRLLEACAATGAPDAAFRRFAHFFERLRAGVQVQSLFLAQPNLFRLIVETLAYSPRLAEALARQSAALDAIMDARFFRPLDQDSGVVGEIEREAAAAEDFEGAMNAVRRIHREQMFRIGLQVLSDAASTDAAGEGYATLAHACLRALAGASMREVERLAGAFPGRVAVLALGKAGSREMTASSDLDLMAVYEAGPEAVAARRDWTADVWYGRFTQRLVAALSARTGEGGLYDVDMRLRPSGTAGPVAVSLAGFADYYAREAQTWEFMALTRAQVAWSSDADFGAQVTAAVDAILRNPRDPDDTRVEISAMRELMVREQPPRGFWDMKRSRGGQIDCEFAAQALQLIHAPDGAPLRPGTTAALRAQAKAGFLDPVLADDLIEAWSLQQGLSQLLAISLDARADPEAEPSGFQRRLARAGGEADFAALAARLVSVRARAMTAYERVLEPLATDSGSPPV
ncbi:bifunctional [glutamine synthetase] adenylyltransferase/[glutamine synthetase]-adenylyl-L-tyrosine phosphorylase [Brevundimonas sp.]|uniref:bifunctional [glutamine synthetase] adenylyltransferase/[glutamine synthetase]-adenylyl-L-tyrosine phosphorylase n=1 Tax=Brevundimonas sp. TaxID=1871086 RepID=UPI0025D213C8|nr:bifunctional [glutamine synthetase] adenylyltransferase/[glutamine synthetase]-adenylyl-L-tyrosine phosphorylase [Brevundimonas sp.]